MSDATIQVQLASDEAAIPGEDEIRHWVMTTLAAANEDAAEVSVRIVDAEEMRALNRDYREKDAPTNVLSFPAGPIAGLPADTSTPLGDVVVCASVVQEEARRQGKAIGDHWAHLLVHGTLHLLGFDHVGERDTAAMEALETKILRAEGVADPYSDR